MLTRTVTRLATFGVWAVVAACAAFWGLKVFVQPLPLPATAQTVSDAQVLRGDPSRVLGATVEPEVVVPVVAAASRFKLIGVVAPRAPSAAAEGLALIAIDGRPARAYRVGAQVEGDLVLQRVRVRGADLGGRDAPVASVALDVAPLPPPATGRPGAVAVPPPMNTPRPLPPPRPAAPAAMSVSEPTGEDDGDSMAEQVEPNMVPIRPGMQTQ